MEYKIIARARTDFPEKFGIPRQSGLVAQLRAQIVFEPEYRDANALKGIEEFSHLWLIWLFSATVREGWSPTVRPPRLGGNERMGVFATRSPFRPNPIGLSCVKLERVLEVPGTGKVLEVSGADLMDGTPVLDIKPYLPYADSIPEAAHGFTDRGSMRRLQVQVPENLLRRIPEEKREALTGVLEQDPRPRYQEDPARVYGMTFAGFTVRFQVEDDTLRVTWVEENAV